MRTTLMLLLAATAAVSAQTAPPLTSRAAVTELSRQIGRVAPAGAALTKSAGPDRETGRVYDLTKNIVIRKKESGTEEKLPFLPLPVLFRKNRTELLDTGSETNLRNLAEALKSITAAEKDARFQIEGHASRDGEAAHNLKLSRDRADAIRRVLVADFEVGAAHLQSAGYGEAYAKAGDHAPETELQKDRVVRVVRVR